LKNWFLLFDDKDNKSTRRQKNEKECQPKQQLCHDFTQPLNKFVRFAHNAGSQKKVNER
jgi:hypothetical protein